MNHDVMNQYQVHRMPQKHDNGNVGSPKSHTLEISCLHFKFAENYQNTNQHYENRAMQSHRSAAYGLWFMLKPEGKRTLPLSK